MNTAKEIQQLSQETPGERKQRHQSGFHEIESKLPARWSFTQFNVVDRIGALFGSWNPLAAPAKPDEHTVWLFDNTAYRPVHRYPHAPQPWQAEFSAAVFVKNNRKKLAQVVADIADRVGIDGEIGENEREAVRKTIADRVAPFVDAIAPARIITLNIPSIHSHAGDGESHHSTDHGRLIALKPSDPSGIVSQTLIVDEKGIHNGQVLHPYLANWDSGHRVQCHTQFASTSGWLVISDIDDCIKITQTFDPVGILRTTFTEPPTPVPGMPELYTLINEVLSPHWTYLSASPYNLYPFLRTFLHTHYPPGTLLLRENSWMEISGLLKTLTQGTQAYKASRINKIHSWLPKRKVLCVGDSTQSDPEVYGEIYRKFPGWIKAIYIRKVTDIAFMNEEKNMDQRFEDAFKDVPRDVWTVFEDPGELEGAVRQLGASMNAKGKRRESGVSVGGFDDE